MAKFPVAIVKYDKTLNSLRKAIELCNGFEELKPKSRVLLKPNIETSGTPSKMPPYGIVTTSRMVAYLIQLLHERGCRDISIGEGTVVNKELGTDTPKGYKWSGIARAAKKYGVKLIDFNNESYQNVELDGVKIRISSVALESEFLINLPVLKTHCETKVSLGLKNLKGCLDMRSRREFHRKGLERMIALLNTKVKPKLTIIDGIYALERGPDLAGTAHRMNLVIAGKDILSCDIVGSTVLGIEPSSVAHLKEFASITGQQLDIGTIDIRGERIKEVTKRLEWRVNLEDTFFRPARIGGVTLQDVDTSCCSGCNGSVWPALMAFCKDNQGTALDNVEICYGSEIKAKKESKRVFLVGSCAIEANRDLEDAIRIKGCPPKMADTLLTLMNHTIDKGKARRILALRLMKLSLMKLGLYDEDFPVYKHYALPEFDRNYFYA